MWATCIRRFSLPSGGSEIISRRGGDAPIVRIRMGIWLWIAYTSTTVTVSANEKVNNITYVQLTFHMQHHIHLFHRLRWAFIDDKYLTKKGMFLQTMMITKDKIFNESIDSKVIDNQLRKCVTFVHRAKYSDMHCCASDTEVSATTPGACGWELWAEESTAVVSPVAWSLANSVISRLWSS